MDKKISVIAPACEGAKMPAITVFTPTYNRAYILTERYDSLVRQTVKDFEWLIVDDGSTDNTRELVEKWKLNDNGFEIKYIFQENAGKSAAINKGVENSRTRLFFILDSDDFLPDNSIELVLKMESTIENPSEFFGVGGNILHKDGSRLGTSFKGAEYLDCTNLQRRENGITGDKGEILYTDVLRKYPFPYFAGEKFVPEAVVWNRIANDGYKIRWFNENIYYRDYLPDGYSKNVDKNLINNWQGYTLYFKELLKSKCSIKEKILPTGGYIYRYIKKILKMY